MSYSTDPVEDAARHYGVIFEHQQRQQLAEMRASVEFLELCQKCDANAIATFAPLVRDYTQKVASIDAAPKRVQLLTEVLQESLNYRDGPSMTEAMQLLINVAFGGKPEDAAAQARRLLERMSETWASQNVEVGE